MEVRRQEEALIKKRNAAVSEMDQEINKATHESVVTLRAVYGEACTLLQLSKRSKRNRNTANRRAREAVMAAAAAIE